MKLLNWLLDLKINSIFSFLDIERRRRDSSPDENTIRRKSGGKSFEFLLDSQFI